MSGNEKTINIDFLLSGCSTKCRHCYVAGGPGPIMPAEDALLCIERLDALAAFLPCEVSFTLDHEPMNHPDLKRILFAAAETGHIQNYHHGMTTGIALMRREDRAELLQAYLDCGYRHFGVTIHGSASHHDELVRRRGAYKAAVAAAEFFKRGGAELELSLMLNRYFPEDRDSISELIDHLRPHHVWFALPIFTPHDRMMDYEPYRASLPDILSMGESLSLWRADAAEFLENAGTLTVAAAAARLRKGPALRELFDAPQNELYLSLHADCVLYVGNSGAETRRIGDLRSIDLRETAETILGLPGNRDYGAFYNPNALPETDALIQALEALPQDLVYGDFESALYRGLSSMGVRTRIAGTP